MTYADTRGARRAVGPADPPDRRAGRRATRAAALRRRPHDERHPSPPRPPPVRARGASESSPTAVWRCSTPRASAARPRRSESRSPGCSPTASSPTRSRSSSATPTRRGRCSRASCATLGIPVALEASMPLALDLRRHLAGRALPRGGRRARRSTRSLAHLRSDPSLDPGAVDWLERRVRRGDAHDGRRSDRGLGDAAAPPRAPARGRRRGRPAAGAGPVGSRARRGCAPRAAPHAVARPPTRRGRRSQPLELRAGVAAAELLEELADARRPPRRRRARARGALEAIESATVPLWRGPADGPGPDPQPVPGARRAGSSALFCRRPPGRRVPERGAARPAALRGAPARSSATRTCAAPTRPTRSATSSTPASRGPPSACTELAELRRGRRGALARSPFVDEVLDLLDAGREEPSCGC